MTTKSFEQSNTDRLIGRATRLGYTITEIETYGKTLSIQIMPTDSNSYTPALARDLTTKKWQAQTTSYGYADADTMQEIVEGYGRASAMIQELNQYSAGNLADYCAY